MEPKRIYRQHSLSLLGSVLESMLDVRTDLEHIFITYLPCFSRSFYASHSRRFGIKIKNNNKTHDIISKILIPFCQLSIELLLLE